MRSYQSYMIIAAVIVAAIPILMDDAFSSDYISVQGFNTKNPGQVAIGEAFSDLVKAKGVPVPKEIQEKPVKIAFIYPGEQVSDYWRRSIASFEARLDEIHIQYDIIEYFSKPVVDYRIQEKQIKTALDADPDYLVFTLDVFKHKRIIERIITEQRPKIILQNITTPLSAWEGKHPFLYVGFDHATGAKLMANYYIKKTHGKGNYALLYFSQGYVSTMRGDKFVDYIKKNSDLKLVSSYYTDGNREKSRRAAMEIINEFPEIKYIYACSTDVALGAIDALEEKAMVGKVMINGWGGGSSELEMIEAQKMDITVMRINDDNGVAMAEAIRFDIEGKGDKVPTIYSGNFALIEKGIRPDELQTLKNRAFRYSGTN